MSAAMIRNGLQNRVSADGSIHAIPSRGLMMGNRGRIHDPQTQSLLNRRWATKAWIICVTDFRGRHREVMGNSYTELFFLDEVTALAAGHRPCFECRRKAAITFRDLCAATQGLSDPPRAADIDTALHNERLLNRGKRLHLRPRSALPDGTVVALEGKYYALRDSEVLAWDFSGYSPANLSVDTLPDQVDVLTPPLSLAALSRGYQPLWHETATI
ncbi:MAG: hypothetical protein AAGE61_14945 [Pseudomonadota bacterium]